MLTEYQLKLYQLPIDVSSQYGIPASRESIIEKYPTDAAAKKAYNKAMKQINVIEIRANKKTKPKSKRKLQIEPSYTTTFWYKSPNGFDISFAKLKDDIPKGYNYVLHLKTHKIDGNTDWEILDKHDKTIWIKRNVNKLSQCQILQLGFDIQKAIHKFLNVTMMTKEYKYLMEKRIKGCKLK